jgi:hypothetical protein
MSQNMAISLILMVVGALIGGVIGACTDFDVLLSIILGAVGGGLLAVLIMHEVIADYLDMADDVLDALADDV